jgi:hypothetical protein
MLSPSCQLLFIQIPRSHLTHTQHLSRKIPRAIPRRQSNLKVSRYRHKRTLNRIVVHVISIRRVCLTCLNLVQ